MCLLQHLKQMHQPLDMVFSQRGLLAVSTIKNHSLCAVALCFVGEHQRREQKSSLMTNFDFCARISSTFSGSVRNHAKAPRKVFQALATSCYAESRGFFSLKQYVERTMWQKWRTYKWKRSREKVQASLPKVMLEVCYIVWILKCNQQQEPKPYLLHVTLLAVTHEFQKSKLQIYTFKVPQPKNGMW